MDLSNDAVIHRRQAALEYLEFKPFPEYNDEIVAVFGIRGATVADYCINANTRDLKELCKIINVDYERSAHQIRQTHSDICVVAPDATPVEADAAITNARECALMIRVADCVAVMIYDPAKRVVANIHSGWRGTLQRIAPKTVRKMQEVYNSRPEDLRVVLCPSIGADHFEVKDDVRVQFAHEFGESHIETNSDGCYLIDAEACIVDSLTEIGVLAQNIYRSGLCTVCHKDLIHSYRGNVESEKAMRNIAIICLK